MKQKIHKVFKSFISELANSYFKVVCIHDAIDSECNKMAETIKSLKNKFPEKIIPCTSQRFSFLDMFSKTDFCVSPIRKIENLNELEEWRIKLHEFISKSLVIDIWELFYFYFFTSIKNDKEWERFRDEHMGVYKSHGKGTPARLKFRINGIGKNKFIFPNDLHILRNALSHLERENETKNAEWCKYYKKNIKEEGTYDQWIVKYTTQYAYWAYKLFCKQNNSITITDVELGFARGKSMTNEEALVFENLISKLKKELMKK